MEDGGNIFEKQFIGMTKTKVGKPPTRLQKHAPASLKLDRINTAAAGTRLFGTSGGTSPAAIPLLSPVTLSPYPFPDTEEFVVPTWKNGDQGTDDNTRRFISTMEDGGNLFEQQHIGLTKAIAGKPPTRLQKRAPASLKLDQMNAAAAGTSPFGSSGGTSPAAIPLLSPLIPSQNSFSEIEEFVMPTWKNGNQGTGDKKAAMPTPIGWKHPAVPAYVEASTVFTLFQTKCLLVNDAQ